MADYNKFKPEKKPPYYIGIDPDTDKSGVALYCTKTKELTLTNLSFFPLMDYLLEHKEDAIVVIEASWLIGHVWHQTSNKKKASSIGKDVGANHQVGKMIADFCKQKNVPYVLKKPLKKPIINGKKSKVPQDLFQKITNYKGRTNQEQRDAALLVYGL